MAKWGATEYAIFGTVGLAVVVGLYHFAPGLMQNNPITAALSGVFGQIGQLAQYGLGTSPEPTVDQIVPEDPGAATTPATVATTTPPETARDVAQAMAARYYYGRRRY